MANRESVLALLALVINQTAKSQVEFDQSYVPVLVPKNFPEGPSCFAVHNRAGHFLGQLAGLRLPVRIASCAASGAHPLAWSLLLQTRASMQRSKVKLPLTFAFRF